MTESNDDDQDMTPPEPIEHDPGEGNGAAPIGEPSYFVDETTPDGGLVDSDNESDAEEGDDAGYGASAETETSDEPSEPRKQRATSKKPQPQDDDEEEPAPVHVWYVLKVQSSREDTIRDALERRVKIQGLEKYFGRIVVPTEKITEIRNNKKRVVERKSYPGYIMVEMELNEKTWFVVRETPGVGDFVGAHGQPSPMREDEVNKMLGQETSNDEKPAPVRIHVERGDRVKIKDGPFENFEGTVEEVVEQRGLVKVMLIIFNRPTPVDLEYWQVERI